MTIKMPIPLTSQQIISDVKSKLIKSGCVTRAELEKLSFKVSNSRIDIDGDETILAKLPK